MHEHWIPAGAPYLLSSLWWVACTIFTIFWRRAFILMITRYLQTKYSILYSYILTLYGLKKSNRIKLGFPLLGFTASVPSFYKPVTALQFSEQPLTSYLKSEPRLVLVVSVTTRTGCLISWPPMGCLCWIYD